MRRIVRILIRQYVLQCLGEKVVPQVVFIVDKPSQRRMLMSRSARQEVHKRLVHHFVTPGYRLGTDVDGPSFQ